jgi:hypothetical protein
MGFDLSILPPLLSNSQLVEQNDVHPRNYSSIFSNSACPGFFLEHGKFTPLPLTYSPLKYLVLLAPD